MRRKRTTSEIAPLVGIDHKSLINYLINHPELRPAERLPNEDYLWSDEEIQRLLDFRASRKRTKQRE